MPHRRGTTMPRKRKPGAPVEAGARRKQFNLALDLPFAARVEKTAQALGLDPVQLLRMICHEHLREYEARAAEARGDKPAGGAPK